VQQGWTAAFIDITMCILIAKLACQSDSSSIELPSGITSVTAAATATAAAIVSPQVFTRDELQLIADLCLQHDTYALSDEVRQQRLPLLPLPPPSPLRASLLPPHPPPFHPIPSHPNPRTPSPPARGQEGVGGWAGSCVDCVQDCEQNLLQQTAMPIQGRGCHCCLLHRHLLLPQRRCAAPSQLATPHTAFPCTSHSLITSHSCGLTCYVH